MKDLLSKKFWTILFIFYVVLFNIPFFGLAGNLNRSDVFLAWVVNVLVAFSLSIILLFLNTKKKELGFITLIFLLTLIPNLIVLSYILIARVHMHHDFFWVIFETNSTESSEYVTQFLTWKILLGILGYLTGAILLYYLSIRSISNQFLSFKKNKHFLLLACIFLLLILTFQSFSNVMSSMDFYKSGINYIWMGYRMKNKILMHQNETMEVSSSLSDSGHTFIVIIGESLSKHHMQIYGYGRSTTPELDSMKEELIIYEDVVSPHINTQLVMNAILTFAEKDHPEYSFLKPSIIDLLRYSGIKTYWISNQEYVVNFGGGYGLLVQQADQVFHLCIEKQTDEIVLPYLEHILNEKTNGNRLIFIHLMGSHYAYKYRYPDNYNFFNHKNDGFLNDKPFLKETQKQTIDEYDNSVRYTDYLVSSIIKKMQLRSEPSLVLFFSDHGEEVFDYRDYCGHDIYKISPYQCEIPFILWCSESYQSEMNHLIWDEQRPFSTGNLIYSLSSLCGLHYPEFIPQKSLFEKQFVPERRMVGDKNYDDIQ